MFYFFISFFSMKLITASSWLPPAGSEDYKYCGPDEGLCDDGRCVALTRTCNALDCYDGRDETLELCWGSKRPFLALILFCSLNWSLQHETLCPDVCRLWPEYCYYALAAKEGAPGTCTFPELPLIGSYSIEDITPRGEAPADFTLVYTCPPGYSLDSKNPRCVDGHWISAFPSCKQDPLLEECGTLTPNREALLANGVTQNRIELPWHSGIYSKHKTPYEQICGGTLVSSSIIISAAHCFWRDSDGQQPAEHYAAVVGKFYRKWDIDDGGQKSEISDIKLPPRFYGDANKYGDDLALLTLAKPMVLTDYVRPVCVDLSRGLDDRQLRADNIGKVAGWGLTSEDGTPSELIKVVEVANVEIDSCIAMSPVSFRSYVTSDKMCAGAKNGTALCKGDSGGGLVFPERVRGAWRWYLRGVASVAPATEHKCNFHTYTFFTQLSRHETFLKKHLDVIISNK